MTLKEILEAIWKSSCINEKHINLWSHEKRGYFFGSTEEGDDVYCSKGRKVKVK